MQDTIARISCLTSGQWLEEEESCADFDRRVEASGCFRIYRECEGVYLQPRCDSELKTPRIDRILTPTAKLVDAGWTHGAIGVECKRSGEKMGPVVAQCLDYSRAVFKLNSVGYQVHCPWIFVWPFCGTEGDFASIMDQGRVGGVWFANWCLLRLRTGGCINMLTVYNDGRIELQKIASGRRTGSR